MTGQRMHQVSGWVMVALSLTALLVVLTALRVVSFAPLAIRTQPPQPDEGTQAHVFQLAILALAPTMLVFLATANGKLAGRSARVLAFSAVAVVLAFVLLYCVEQMRFHGR